jgi:hypothetical protein
MRGHGIRRLAALLTGAGLCAAAAGAAVWDDDFDREAWEEPAGASFSVLLNPSDDLYGIGFGAGVWLKGTPVFGDTFVHLFENGLEEAWYSALGMTLRLQPRWRLAPFAGVGGSYNLALDGSGGEAQGEGDLVVNGQDLSARGRSYWGGHVEAGLRLRLPPPVRLLEVCGRYTWSSNEGDVDTWLLCISTGAGW